MVSQRNTPYLVNKLLAQLSCVTVMFFAAQSRLRSDLIRKKVNVFLLQTTVQSKGNSEYKIVELK